MTHKHVVLASGSTYRKQQLQQIGLKVEAISPNIDETALPNEPPQNLAERLAITKGQAIACGKFNPTPEKPPNSSLTIGSNVIIISADQTAAIGTKQLCKPGSIANAIQQLQLCSAQQVTFYTSVCLTLGKTQLTETIPTQVQFRKLSSEQIENYVNTEKPLDCAGSFKCEGLGIALFESITSSDPSALIGLPLISVVRMLKKLDFDVLANPYQNP